MKYIASCSFGKDSLAAIIIRMEHNEPVDGAVYCRIMFDDNISAELPEHEAFIHEKAIPLLKSRYGIETQVVQAKRTYLQQFYTKYKDGAKAGHFYGFPLRKGPWCNNLLKLSPIKTYEKSIGKHLSMVGIAADETRRIPQQLAKGNILPLVDCGITEAQAFQICRKHDLLSPAYNGERFRLGCWFCHNQRISELRRLRHDYPELWGKLLNIDKDSHLSFKPDHTLQYFENRFSCEISEFMDIEVAEVTK